MEFAVLALLFVASVSTVFSTTFESDTTALTAMSKGWATGFGWSGDPCANRWRGVTCDTVQNSNVTKLILSNLNLDGRLLPSVGDLQNLQTLDLSFNPKLIGPLPKALGNLQNLVYLNLQMCGFTGSIPPELGLLKKLNFLALNMNSLSGSIPPELGGLSSLTWFDLAQNNGISGTLPISSDNLKNVGLDNLTLCKHFHLNNNSLSGSFPKEITSLPNLIHLLLDSNLFTGEIPEEFGNFSSLQILRIDNNQFSGSLPSTIARVANLTEIHARNNKLSGLLPDFSGLSELKLLVLGENMYDPQPVPSLAKLMKLQTLEIDGGNLIGSIPSDFFMLPELESASLKDNHINGSVNLIGASSSISDVELDNNNITSVALGPQFSVSLSGNPACKDSRLNLSPEVCTVQSTGTWVRHGQLKSCQNTCSAQRTLNPNTCSCAFPLQMILVFNAPTFSTLDDKRMDRLRANLSEGLNLSTDQIWAISANFTTSHRLLVSLDFFPLTGDAMTTEQVSFIISQTSTHQITKYMQDFGPYAFFAPPVPPPQVAGEGKSSGLSTGVIIGIAVAGVLLLAVIAGVPICVVRQKRKADGGTSNQFPFGTSWGSRGKDNSAPQLKGARFFSLAELKKATNNFSSSKVIGVGGYGKVYKGVLLAGEEVAIKRAEEGSLQGSTEFRTEIELLSRVHHRNLVGLVGFCYEQGEQMLVYEYMSKGTIREHLSEHSTVLNWRKRLEIAVGSARGIAYLHELADPPIIHRDIKSSNILLDEKFIAKVADFGLSKLAPGETKGHVSTQVKGTLGYLDPEYYMTQQLSEKSDVYSFGVVLLELITARMPIENNKYIVREVRAALDKANFSHLALLLDPSLQDYPRRDLEKFVEIALSCVDDSASMRPTMSEVVKQLEVLLANVSSSGFSRDNSIDGGASAGGGAAASPGIYPYLLQSQDPKFQYSGGFPARLEPK